MIRSALYLLAGAGLFSSCSSVDWKKLDPTYIEPTLVNDNQPVLRVLSDGRDISGYKIPENQKSAYKGDAGNVVPVGTWGSAPHSVISPFSPHKVLDATGMKPGDLVRDPDNLKIFRLPSE